MRTVERERGATAVIVAIMIVSLVAVGWDRWTNIEVYFDNGLDQTVKLDLDGKHFDLGENATQKEEMHEGKHSVIVRGADGKEMAAFKPHVFMVMGKKSGMWSILAARPYAFAPKPDAAA